VAEDTQNPRGGIPFALLTVVGMAAFTLLLRAALQYWSVGAAGVLSRIVTLASLGGWVLATGSGWRRLSTRGVGRRVLSMGVISIGVNLLLYGSLVWTTATNHALLYRLDLVFVVLIGSLLGLERIGLKQFLLLPVMLGGVALVLEVQDFRWQGHFVGDVMVVGAALLFATNAFIIRGLLRTMDAAAAAFYNHGISAVGFVLLMLIEGRWDRSAGTWMRPEAWLAILLVGLSTAVTLPLYYAALRRMAIWKLRTWLLLTPMAVAAAEWLLWDSRLKPAQTVGAAIVLGGLAVLIRLEARGAREDQGAAHES
jgi:drug/metabolite transporter (DMT)-like permease